AEMGADLRQLADEDARPRLGPSRSIDRPHGWPRWAIAGVMALLASGMIAMWAIRARPGSGLTERDTIVLGDFTNRTGDAVFDDTLRQGLAVQLEQSPFLGVVPDEQIRQVWKDRQPRSLFSSARWNWIRVSRSPTRCWDAS